MGKFGSLTFLYPGSDLYGSQKNFMGSTLGQDPSSHFLHEDPTSSVCEILLTKK